MAKNRDDLATEALEELRLPGVGQAPSAEETAKATAAIDPLLERLRGEQIYAQQNTYSFNDDVFRSLAMLLAEELAPSLRGRAIDVQMVEYHQARLMRIQRKPLIRNNLRVDRGLTRLQTESFNG